MDPDRLHHLEQQLRSPSLQDRKAALDELARVPSDLAVPLLQRLAMDPDFLRRRLAVMGLGNHRTTAAFIALTELLAEEADSNVVAEIANSLFEFGEVAVPLFPDLFHRCDDWLVRQTILGILVDAEVPEVLLEVIRMGLKDATVTTRETAILSLGQLVQGDFQTEAIDLLLEVAKSEQWRDRWRAATVLCRATEERARMTLAQLRQDENRYVVAAALEALMI
ncbi:MAG: HEAT repeat domain-containing protein [Synechococcales bacterium]|nr:HEAT repeat domain-containing protein [Synechococcales bacterium]